MQCNASRIAAIWVDVRAAGAPLAPAVAAQLRTLRRLESSAGQEPVCIVLWVHETSSVDAATLTAVQPGAVHTLPRDINGYIGKAYALLHTPRVLPSVRVAAVFDSDSWPCQQWREELQPLIQTRPQSDLLWSLAPIKFGGYRGRDGTFAVSPLLLNGSARMRHQYARFGERNSGTIIATRSSSAVTAWLEDALKIYHWQLEAGFIVGAGGLADQPALREAAFLHRHALRETLLPPLVACRGLAARGTCPLARSRQCAFLHSKSPGRCHCRGEGIEMAPPQNMSTIHANPANKFTTAGVLASAMMLMVGVVLLGITKSPSLCQRSHESPHL